MYLFIIHIIYKYTNIHQTNTNLSLKSNQLLKSKEPLS